MVLFPASVLLYKEILKKPKIFRCASYFVHPPFWKYWNKSKYLRFTSHHSVRLILCPKFNFISLINSEITLYFLSYQGKILKLRKSHLKLILMVQEQILFKTAHLSSINPILTISLVICTWFISCASFLNILVPLSPQKSISNVFSHFWFTIFCTQQVQVPLVWYHGLFAVCLPDYMPHLDNINNDAYL